MSRLESMIRRLNAQRACLDLACDIVREQEGVVLELGLGNGRTYDHLCQRMPGREIYVLDRVVDPHWGCRIDPARVLLGDIRDTLPVACERFRGRVVLVHNDIGIGVPAFDREMAATIGHALGAGLAHGAVVLSNEALEAAGCVPLPLPDGVEAGRYFLYRKPPAAFASPPRVEAASPVARYPAGWRVALTGVPCDGRASPA